MRFTELGVRGAYLVEAEPHADERGLFARTWCAREFAARGLSPRLVQASVSFNRRQGTLRGLHYQTRPAEEAKLVRCTAGRVWDVVLDLRPDSPTYLAHAGVELRADSRAAVYVPEGCAHGFLTLTDGAEVLYQMSEYYAPASSRGVRWNDPAFAIPWPAPVVVIGERDRTYPDFHPAHGAAPLEVPR
jgi:dTDP-4-dehydrorhamnose 3,5-epimerase